MAWKIYFIFYLALNLWAYGFSWGERWIVYDYLDPLVQIVLLTGLYGYAFKKRIAGAGFWRKYLPFVIVWDLAGLLVHYEPSQDSEAAVFMGIAIYLLYLIIIPAYCALFFYGHKSEELWNSQSSAP